MHGSQGIKVEAGQSPALYRNCRSQDKSGILPQIRKSPQPSRLRRVGLVYGYQLTRA